MSAMTSCRRSLPIGHFRCCCVTMSKCKTLRLLLTAGVLLSLLTLVLQTAKVNHAAVERVVRNRHALYWGLRTSRSRQASGVNPGQRHTAPVNSSADPEDPSEDKDKDANKNKDTEASPMQSPQQQDEGSPALHLNRRGFGAPAKRPWCNESHTVRPEGQEAGEAKDVHGQLCRESVSQTEDRQINHGEHDSPSRVNAQEMDDKTGLRGNVTSGPRKPKAGGKKTEHSGGEGGEKNEHVSRETQPASREVHHVFFLKVHKAGSTTMQNVLFRFALDRRLTVMLPTHGNLLSERSKNWTHGVMPLPRGADHFDILCNHLVFHEPAVRWRLDKGAKFVAIVREPFQQFLSAFHYYRNRYHKKHLVRIQGPDPVATYLQNPARYEPKRVGASKTHNRMSFDFGMEPATMRNELAIDAYIRYLNATFDLVLVSEQFDLSMVLLKRTMGWRLQDVLYVSNNVFAKPPPPPPKNNGSTIDSQHYTSQQKLALRNFNLADHKLYDHFLALFERRVENEGDHFKDEVDTFVVLRKEVEQFCRGSKTESVRFAATDWSPVFEVHRKDCHLMTLAEGPFVQLMRSRQYPPTDQAN